MSKKNKNLDKEALSFHSNGRPGKLEISATKPLTSQHDLSLAYGDYTQAEAGKTLKVHVAHLPERAESFWRAL